MVFPSASDDDARSGLLAREAAGDNAPALSISELSQLLKRTVEDRFGFVRVRGELSGVKRAASGHLYLSLKDENARLREENERLRRWQSIALALDAENQRLKAALRWIPDPTAAFVTARVIASTPRQSATTRSPSRACSTRVSADHRSGRISPTACG